jgi:hypothetical protein
MKRLVAPVLALSVLAALAPVDWSAGVRQVIAGTTIHASVGPCQTTYGPFSIRSSKSLSITVQTNISRPPGAPAGRHYHPGAVRGTVVSRSGLLHGVVGIPRSDSATSR